MAVYFEISVRIDNFMTSYYGGFLRSELSNFGLTDLDTCKLFVAVVSCHLHLDSAHVVARKDVGVQSCGQV